MLSYAFYPMDKTGSVSPHRNSSSRWVGYHGAQFVASEESLAGKAARGGADAECRRGRPAIGGITTQDPLVRLKTLALECDMPLIS